MQKTIPHIPLSKLVTIPPKSYPSTNIEQDAITLLENYIPSASTLEIIERFSAGLCGAKNGRMLSITGPYGSGKSTMAIFLKGLLAPSKSKEWKASLDILKKEPPQFVNSIMLARKSDNKHKKGMIRCTVMARREPLSVTILRGLHNGFVDYFGEELSGLPNRDLFYRCFEHNKKPQAEDLIKIIEDAAKISPIMLMIDEFGKNIEYFASDESQQSDLFLLQELAERSGKNRKIPLSIVTLQHMAFEEYAVGASTAQKKEWSKIQGRFEDIPFANSPEQTRQLISNTILLSTDSTHRRHVVKWAKKESRLIQDIGLSSFSSELIASCYPLNPIALEVIPELCSRYGQRERTLLSFISDSKKHTVATFIDENYWNTKTLPTMGLDSLYDFFISGTGMIHSSSQNISRLMEVETIIRDAHGLGDIEKKALKTIGMLNLVGRSGHLRASRRIIDYLIGQKSQQILQTLEKRSMITYRNHADEYRIWHGTDVDIAAKLEMYRSRHSKVSLFGLLDKVIALEPVVAARHSIKNGIMRLFERRFRLEPSDIIDENFDGVILYDTYITDGKTSENLVGSKLYTDIVQISSHRKPVIVVTPRETTDLKLAAIEVAAIRDILDSEDDILKDWVARREFEERLADAEVMLDREFTHAYGRQSKWSFVRDGKTTELEGTPSSITSDVCDIMYNKAPIIKNEMINRTNISAQGSTAKKVLLEKMILHHDKPKFGIDGNGPDRAIYEAVFFENGLHVNNRSFGWRLVAPRGRMKFVWNAMFGIVKKSKKRIVLTDIYKTAKMPPYGVRDGPLQLIFLVMFLVYRQNLALYEHGTFVPKLRAEIAERMTKNPDHFEIKYFGNSAANKFLLENVAKQINISSGNRMLDVVGHLVRTVNTLSPYVKSTKSLDKKTIKVRDSILAATEPDTLLFETLPNALGFGGKMSHEDGMKFARMLIKSMNALQKKFDKMFEEISKQLFFATGIEGRENLSNAAKTIQKHVTDQKMKVFLSALSADVLEKDDDWLNYIAMSLTDIPPTDWKDDQRIMFENNLSEYASRFRRMASLHFSDISGKFVKESCQLTMTRADGSEYHTIISLEPAKKKKFDKMLQKMTVEMKANGFTDRELSIFSILLGKKTD